MMVVYDNMAAVVSNFHTVKKITLFFLSAWKCQLIHSLHFRSSNSLIAVVPTGRMSQSVVVTELLFSQKKIILDSAVDDAHVPNSWCFGIQLKSSSGVLAKHGLRARFLRLKASQLWRGPLSRQRMRRSRRKCGGRNSGDNVPFKKKASWSQQSDVTQ